MDFEKKLLQSRLRLKEAHAFEREGVLHGSRKAREEVADYRPVPWQIPDGRKHPFGIRRPYGLRS